jgi:hypothetical protein
MAYPQRDSLTKAIPGVSNSVVYITGNYQIIVKILLRIMGYYSTGFSASRSAIKPAPSAHFSQVKCDSVIGTKYILHIRDKPIGA